MTDELAEYRRAIRGIAIKLATAGPFRDAVDLADDLEQVGTIRVWEILQTKGWTTNKDAYVRQAASYAMTDYLRRWSSPKRITFPLDWVETTFGTLVDGDAGPEINWYPKLFTYRSWAYDEREFRRTGWNI